MTDVMKLAQLRRDALIAERERLGREIDRLDEFTRTGEWLMRTARPRADDGSATGPAQSDPARGAPEVVING